MATCEVTSDVTPNNLVDGTDENEVELDMQVNADEAELFQKDINRLTVNDVYNIAASIGKEFEKLTDAFGGAVFSEIMPKIIRVLEMLETYTARSQNFSSDVVELQAMIQKLQIEGKSNVDKHKEDLDMVDNAWRDETRQLLQTVETLQEDNKRLTQLLTEKLDAPEDLVNGGEQQATVVRTISDSVEKQRDELREKDRVIEQQSSECEALSAQAQQLTKLNVNLRRKLAMMEKQASAIASQTTDLDSTCREKDRQLKDLQNRVADLSSQVKTAAKPSQAEAENHSTSQELLQAPDDPLLAGKLIIDLNDPDRPRYTMHELQEVLVERNTFKLKCMLLEDELGYYKQFLKINGKEESWEEIESNEFLESPEHEINNNQHHHNSNHDTAGSTIKKLFASLFTRKAKSPEIPHEPPRPRLPSHLRYPLDSPLLDLSDVMPAIDITPSPEERDNAEFPEETGLVKPTDNESNDLEVKLRPEAKFESFDRCRDKYCQQ